MPIKLQKQIEQLAHLHIWEMTESREELLQIADPGDTYLQSLEKVTHPKRRKELFALKALLKSINFNRKITYLPNGKPFVDDITHISVSHCRHIAGFIQSRVPCGMDIQDKNEKIRLISRRFCNEMELENAKNAEDPLAYFTCLWSIKEAVFKVFGEDLPFAENIQVQDFDPEISTEIKVNCKHGSHQYDFTVRKEKVQEFFVLMAFLEG